MPAVEAQDPPYFGAIVELDKVVYNWTDGVWIVVTAPNFNSDPFDIDYIGCGGSIHLIGDRNECSQSLVTITSTHMINNITMYKEKLDWYMLEETGVDTGVFIGHVLLTGFSHDVDGDGRDDPIMNIQSWNNVNENITGDTSGGGPWDGRIKANPGNTITVKFSEKYSGTTNFHEANATVEFWVAELGLQSAVIASNQPVTVTVVDQDMNLGFFNRDQLYVDVYSDSDAGGFRLLLTETEILDDDGTSFIIQNSGIFEGQFSSVSVGGTTGSLAEIFAKPGDTITVLYNECTLPQPFSLGYCLGIAGTTVVGTSIHPLERFGFTNARVVDEFGNSVSEVTVGQQIQIVSDVTNFLDKKHSFAYVVAVQNSSVDNDEYVALEWTEGSLDRFESAFPAVSWIPSAPGSYTVTLAVWVSVDDPSALAPMQSIDIDVIAKTPESVTAIPEWIKNNAGWWADGQIDDSSFLQGIQFLIKEGIMVIPPTETSGSSDSQGVPAWVKNNAGWWADGQIDDNSFVSGIQYLVKAGIIQVD